MTCRICDSCDIIKLGAVEYYSNFAWDIFNCLNCGCRFSKHDDGIYDYLHSKGGSSYGTYREIQERCKRMFKGGDVNGLKKELSLTSKYRFVIQSVERIPKDCRLLEVGCSRGYLTAYFILAGYNVTGVDVSAQAVGDARAAFGDYFVTSDSPAVAAAALYDVIYHVGTIGCVGNPINFTWNLLKMLKPGGQLLFNAPNADSCSMPGQLWIDAAPPPDVVTLFRPEFWKRFFCDAAVIVEDVETLSADNCFAIGLRKLAGRRWQAPVPHLLEDSFDDFKRIRPDNGRLGTKIWSLLERSAFKIARVTRTLGLAPKQPSPFGLFVTMTKK